MLSIAIVKNSGAASTYYAETDNYYTGDRSPSQWMGAGAERMGLADDVDATTFTRLLDGHLPNGSHIHNAGDGRRAGIDLTFSAPKSVSMQALIGGDSLLVEAHQTAVGRALDYVQGLAAYRVTDGGQTELQKSGNLLIASFLHDLSRDTDPQLHTHAVLINATQRADGEWRALEPGEILRQKMLVGALYRSELALEALRLGYDIRLTHADGRFELVHISDRQVQAFSQRSQAITTALANDGLTRADATHTERQRATLATREAKGEVNRTALRETWQEKSHDLGIDFSLRRVLELPTVQIDPASTREAVAHAIAHTTERQSVVTDAQILRAALEVGTGGTNLDAIRGEISHQLADGLLIAQDGRYTTPAAQQREREILAMELRGRAAVEPIMDVQQVGLILSASNLRPGQQAAAALMLATDGRVSAIQGLAGTGKTAMLGVASPVVHQRGYQLVGIAPSAAAARELSGVGIKSETIAAFINREASGLTPQTALIVDEAGMVSARDMHAILSRVEQANARVVLIGDVQQLQAIEAGRPFAQLQEAGIARAEMSEILRQNDARLRHAVELAAHGDSARSLSVLSQNVIEIDDSRERHQAIAREFAGLSLEERKASLIVAGTRAARASVNEQVRTALGLAGQGIMVATMERKDLTVAQARSSLSYQAGDVVVAQKSYASLGIGRGDWARVEGVSQGRVTLLRSDGGRVDWRPSIQTNLSAYQPVSRELALGDAVRLTANDYGRETANGDRAIVTGIDAERQTVTLGREDGRQLVLDASQPLHLDHGYCVTVHASQGQTVSRVLVEADSRSMTMNENAWYVAISRARDAVTIYTDDRSMLSDAVSRESAKVAALELDTARQHRRDGLEIGG